VITQGESMEEARAMLADALEQMWLARRDLSLAEAQPGHQTERLAVELAGLP
jgi:predicted RNase H-like HicB family nuclease